ncbi:MAG: succinylglutamate desuccinylase/aspartoacylase family protein [bacterium]|nr:succinylglutamate desuccinylase/aspartoacylase family protein [bacterium]
MTNNSDVINIAGSEINCGERKNLRLKVSESFISNPTYIPLTVIKGVKPGPVLLVTAAVHGDELNGIEIVRQLIHYLSPDEISGTLICVPVVNIYGFQNSTRYLPDGHDLNRFFPGDPFQWSQGRYAYIIFNELVLKSNYIIDIHTAAAGRSNLPHIRANMAMPEVDRMARAFGTTVILDYIGTEGSLRRAATDAGVPAITLEAGETRKFEKKIAERGLLSVFNVMRELKMIDGEVNNSEYQLVIKKTSWIRADRGGILSINTRPGRVVKKGKELATNTNPFGKEVESIKAPFSGVVIGIATAPTVVPGEGVCHLFLLKEPVRKVRQKLMEIFGRKRIVF